MNNEVRKETNLEHYKEELKVIYGSRYDCPFEMAALIKARLDENMNCGPESGNSKYTDDILEWMAQPYEAPILDSVEKRYLKSVIKPFRNRVKFIYLGVYVKSYYRVNIVLEPDTRNNTDFISLASLPPFPKGTMYKGMKIWEKYTLKELGL